MKNLHYKKITSEADVREFINKADKKIISYGANPLPITTDLKDRIVAFKPVFVGLIDIRNHKARAQAKCVREKDLYMLLTYKYNKVFIYALNGQIDLGVHPGNTGFRKEDRLYYGLGLKQTSLPLMSTDSQILLVNDEIIAGETSRIDDGGTPIALPTLAQILANRVLIDNKVALLVPAKDELNTAKTNVADSKFIGVDLYDELHDQLELAFRTLETEEKRKFMREWGIIFKGDTETQENVYGTISTEGTGLDEVSIFFKEIDFTVKNEDDGTFSTNQIPAGIYTVIITRLHYNDVTIANFEVKHEIKNLLNCEMTLHLG